jgi:hypothetical protein
MPRAIREYDAVRLTVPLIGEPEAGNYDHKVDLPVGTGGSVMEDWGDGYECLFDIPDPESPGYKIHVLTGVRPDQIELAD